MIVVNFKTYPQTAGEKAVAAAKICQKVEEETGIEIIIGVQAADIYRVTFQVKIPVFGQHVDPIEPNRNTGWTTVLSLKEAGARGVFLNHSEHPFAHFNQLVKAINLAKKEGLKVLVFVKDLEVAMKVDKLNPDYIALEEPSLVSKEAMIQFPKFKQIIKQFSQSINSFPILGAGIRTKNDVIESLALGIKGIAFASEFVQTKDPHQLLLDFSSCFK